MSENSPQMLQDNKTFRRSNEILYVFYSADELDLPSLSKIGIQKCIYLCEILSPLKEIILSFLNFIYYHKGPFSKDITNISDHLVALDGIEVDSFSTYGKYSYVNYKITEAGKSLVESLIYDPTEKEKLQWIKIVMRLIDAYKDAFDLSEEYSGVDKIIDLVYQEPSFYEIKQRNGKGELIPMGDKNNLTMELIHFLEKVEESLPPKFDREKYKLDLETVLLAFFEYLYVKYLSEKAQT